MKGVLKLSLEHSELLEKLFQMISTPGQGVHWGKIWKKKKKKKHPSVTVR